MDFIIQAMIFLMLGVVLLAANYWFIRSIQRTLFGNEVVIAPFEVIGKDAASRLEGGAMARMLQARLGQLQRNLQAARGGASGPSTGAVIDQQQLVTTLIVTQAVEIPTGLLQPINVNVSVGGVEVGGILSWVQRLLSKRRTLTFTILEKEEATVVSADLRGFVQSDNPYLWFESKPSPDEITTNIAYALVQKKLSENKNSQIAALDLMDFRTLLDGLFEVKELNQKVRQHLVVDSQFAALLPRLDQLRQKVPQWHELTYLLASIAESSGSQQRAIEYLRALRQASDTRPPGNSDLDPRLRALISAKLAKYRPAIEGLGTDEQMNFIRTAGEFARLMGFKDPDPAIEFKKPEMAEIQAQWNSEARRYEVNPEFIKTPGLPQYVALMGRFLDRNYDRCFGKNRNPPEQLVSFWNEFRHSVVGYLIQSVPQFANVENVGAHYPFFRALKAMEAPEVDPVKRLALELLDRFDCDWNRGNLEKKIIDISKERGLLPERVVRNAFAKGRGKA